MILEGLVTTIDAAGQVNVAPMGPEVTEAMDRLVLKPFRTSRTYANLAAHGEGVFHVTDDVELLAHAAVEDVSPALRPARNVRGFVIESACSAYEFRVTKVDDTSERARLESEVVGVERIRDFLGFCRARFAVLEAAILATRVGILPAEEITSRLPALAILVEKTGGPAEHRAFRFLDSFIEEALRTRTYRSVRG